MSGSSDKRRKRWLHLRWLKDPSCDYCARATRMCLPDEETGIAPDDMATTDHYIPKAKGGIDHSSNWRLSCMKCNAEKEDQWPEVWLGADAVWEAPEPPVVPSALAMALSAIRVSTT